MSGGVLRPRDLPTLQKALRSCDRSLLKRVIIEDYACCDACVGEGRRKAMERRLDASLDAMDALRVDKRPNKGWVLAPKETYVLNARGGTILWRLHAVLVPRYDTATAERIVRAAGGCSLSYEHVKSVEGGLRALVNEARGNRADGQDDDDWGERSYALAPWEHTLGTRVWLEGDWCRRERYLVLASAYWEMTFYGFEYDRVQARMAREKAARLTGAPEASPGIAGAPSLQSDRFAREAQKRLAQRVAVLNHNARCAFFEQMLDLAQRMERG